MTFHSFRDGNRRSAKGAWLWRTLWALHDHNPLPPRVNHFLREWVLAPARVIRGRLRAFLEARRSLRRAYDLFGDPVVPADRFLEPLHSFLPMSWERVQEWFSALHEMNEYLRLANGAWMPQPFANYAGKGVPIEDVALRVLGYAFAYQATGDAVFLERALGGSRYLLRERRFGDGHLLLQGHTVIDTTYTFAGLAWLKVWEITSDERAFAAARDLGDHLVSYQIAGSINHAVTPAQLLADLYRVTGDEKYLQNAVKRVRRAALPNQLPYGGWPTEHESWSWYHAIITKSVVRAYLAAPFTLEYYAKKDQMARCIYRALNRFIVSQRPDGSIKAGRGKLRYDERDEYGSNPREQWVTFHSERGFTHVAPREAQEFYALELDCLCEACVELPAPGLRPVIEGLATCLSHMKEVWRPEFNTMAAGHYMWLRKVYAERFMSNGQRPFASAQQESRA